MCIVNGNQYGKGGGVFNATSLVANLQVGGKAYLCMLNSFWIRKFGESGPQDSLFGESMGPNR